MSEGEEAEYQSSSAYEQKLDIRLNGGQSCNTNQSPKGKRKTKTVNQEVVERKICVLPRETRLAYQKDMCDKKFTDGGQLRS